MLMVTPKDELSANITLWALEAAQRKIGGKIRQNKLYPIVGHLKGFVGTPAAIITDPSWPWYVLQIESQRTAMVELGLKRKRFPFYFPQEPKSVRKNQFERRLVMRPLLVAGYVFTSFLEEDSRWKELRSILGIMRVLCFEERPVPIPDPVMQRIRDREAMLGAKHRKHPPSPVAVGDWVQVTDGPMNGFFGKVVTVLEAQQRITVEVDLFGRQTPVEVSVNQVRAV